MTYIQRFDGGDIINLIDAGIRTKDFIVASPTYAHENEKLEGVNGVADLETTIDPREITGVFRFIAKDWMDYGLMRDKVFRLFRSDESFYITEARNKGKRWLVKVDSSFQIPQRGMFGDFEVPFVGIKGLAESIGTTLEPRTFDSELWQVGQGLRAEDLKYTHDTNKFQIYNAGDETVDPRYMELVIKYHGSGDNLKITNHTTGDVWQYNESLTDSTIKLDGIHSYKNDTSIFSDTNKKLISIAPGFNDFSVEGTEGSFLISFNFRFYYL